MYPCTYDKNLEMIQPLVQEKEHFLVFSFGPLVAKLRIRLDRNLVHMYNGTYEKSFGSIALIWFSKMAAWRPYLKSDRAEIW
jgi:hypothetical protein